MSENQEPTITKRVGDILLSKYRMEYRDMTVAVVGHLCLIFAMDQQGYSPEEIAEAVLHKENERKTGGYLLILGAIAVIIAIIALRFIVF